jgi:MbtH protein
MEAVMTNPFDEQDGTFLVLINHEGQHSLWPTFAQIPDGWSVTFGPESRPACVDYVDQNWVDMRPNSLARLSRGTGGLG